jgi:hypothetical protein
LKGIFVLLARQGAEAQSSNQFYVLLDFERIIHQLSQPAAIKS